MNISGGYTSYFIPQTYPGTSGNQNAQQTVSPVTPVSRVAATADSTAIAKTQVSTIQQAKSAGMSQAQIKQLLHTGKIECETCKNRKYQDGSDEMNVSCKSPTHISPGASGAAVMAHEQQHVGNAYAKAAKENGKVLQASVQIHTSICPECGRTYVSGGETTTKISYSSSPYSQNAKSADAASLVGMNLDLSA
jgi:hypothetical protein